MKREVAHMLRTMTALLEIKGESSFKVRAYERAADSIEGGDYPLEAMAQSGGLTGIPGIGKNLAPKVSEIVLTGRSAFLEDLVREVPEGLLDLLSVPGIGPKTARLLFDSLGVESLDSLEVALENHEVQKLPGLGKKREELIAAGLREIRKYTGRLHLGMALPVAGDVLQRFQSAGYSGVVVGEVRRYLETVASIDILVMAACKNGPGVIEKTGIAGTAKDSVIRQAWNSEKGAFSFSTSFGIPLNVYFAEEDCFFAKDFFLTGPDSYVGFVERKAKMAGYRLTEEGLFKNDRLVPVESEQELCDLARTGFVPPEARHREDLFESISSGHLQLIAPEDIMGDLHVHTVWSDGRSTVEEMVKAAIGKGYSYMAVTDHASTLRLVDGLTPEKLMAQLKEIQDVSGRFPDFRIYSGVEVDILRDGRLFLEDDLLAKLDVVIASVHDDVGDRTGEIVNRLVKAARNPHVDIIGHPTGRIIGRRPGAAGDLTKVFQAAADSGTFLEINASPERLDLSEDMVFQARRQGAKFAINSDAHSAKGLHVIEYGVFACARRAGLSKSCVANALPWRSPS